MKPRSSWWSTAVSRAIRPQITVRPEKNVISAEYKQKWGEEDIKIPVEENNTHGSARPQLPELHALAPEADAGCRDRRQAQVLITMAVQSYREGRVLYFDEKTWKVSPKPSRLRAGSQDADDPDGLSPALLTA